MKIKTAVITLEGDHTVMTITMDVGQVRIDGTALKPAVLAVCVGVTGQAVDDGGFPVAPVTIPMVPNETAETVIERATQEPEILELARQWYAGEIGAQLGPVPVPSFAAADAATWERRGDALVRVA